MPTDAEVIAKARAIGSDCTKFSYFEIMENIKALADISEKRGAMAVEERARYILETDEDGKKFVPLDIEECPHHDLGCDEECNLKRCPSKNFWLQVAAKELDLESTSWRKIGPEDIEKLSYVLKRIEYEQALPGHFNYHVHDGKEVLRRLISSEDEA
jgi:hypothetical protein